MSNFSSTDELRARYTEVNFWRWYIDHILNEEDSYDI